jgi:hypothetical protein
MIPEHISCLVADLLENTCTNPPLPKFPSGKDQFRKSTHSPVGRNSSWVQEVVQVEAESSFSGAPHLEWVGKYPWPHKRNNVDGRIFTKISNFI